MANQYTSGWTDEDVAYLKDRIGSLSFDKIATKLGKTPLAVIRKAEKLGISNTKFASGLMTMHELASCLCVSDRVVKRLIVKNGLPAERKNFRSNYSAKDGKKISKRLFYYIDVKQFWKWAENNKDLINWYQVPYLALPPEPEWLEDRRKEDYYKWVARPRPWTPEQDSQLWALYYREGIPQKKIANIMSRSKNGIEKRLKKLREIKLQSAQ